MEQYEHDVGSSIPAQRRPTHQSTSTAKNSDGLAQVAAGTPAALTDYTVKAWVVPVPWVAFFKNLTPTILQF